MQIGVASGCQPGAAPRELRGRRWVQSVVVEHGPVESAPESRLVVSGARTRLGPLDQWCDKSVFAAELLDVRKARSVMFDLRIHRCAGSGRWASAVVGCGGVRRVADCLTLVSGRSVRVLVAPCGWVVRGWLRVGGPQAVGEQSCPVGFPGPGGW